MSAISASVPSVVLPSRASSPLRTGPASWNRWAPLCAGAMMLALYLMIVA